MLQRIYQFSRATRPSKLTKRHNCIYQLESNGRLLPKDCTLGDFVACVVTRTITELRNVK
jgi:hypothetical protein